MKLPFKFFLLFVIFSNISFGQVYLDSTAAVEERVEDLLSRMTLDEKIGQMIQADHKAITNMNDMLTYHIGSVLSGGGSDPNNGNSPIDWADLYDSFQQKAMDSRLMIPIIYGIDAVHGHSNVTDAVIFPHNIGLGCANDSLLTYEIGRITAIEMAATGMDWAFAPCIAVPRNERWGRTYEGFAEIPEIVSSLGVASVKGLQGDSLNMKSSVVACAKHYMGDGGTTDGIDQGNTELTEAELRDIHLPAYIDAIENNVKTVMISFSSWNGQKMHGNSYLINDVLKSELGFEGFVISDWEGIDQLPGNYSSDILQSVNAGIDMVMVPNNYAEFFNLLKAHVNSGFVTEARINDAVKRILTVKFELGLFERPYASREYLPLVGSDSHREVGKEAVRKSAVILKKNDNVLPLPKSNAKILVVGRHANDIGLQCGGWTIQWQGGVGEITTGTTILEGLQSISSNNEIIFSEDGSYSGEDPEYIISVIGEEPYAEGSGDREDLNLSSGDISLIRSLREKGVPIITVLISGRPMIINPVLHMSDVFIAAWLPGTEGSGIADILFGDFSPQGLLSFSWPKDMEQLPINFGDSDYMPLFPYGFGITTLENSVQGSNPVINSAMIKLEGNKIELSFNKSMASPINANAQFNIIKNGSEPLNILNINLDENNSNLIILETEQELYKNDELSLSFISGTIMSEDGGLLLPFNQIEVFNLLDYLQPSIILPGRVEAENFTNMFGVQTETTSDIGGGLNVGWIDNGDWLEYRCKLDYSGTFFIKFRVASLSSGGKIKFFIDDEEKFEQIIPITNGWQNWTTVSSLAEINSGEFVVKLVAEQGGFNLNWFDFDTFVNINENENISNNFYLIQNFPNPFNPSTQIEFSIPKNDNVLIKVFNILGETISIMADDFYNAGKHRIQFDASSLSSGVYFYSISTGEFHQVKKMIFAK